MRYFACCVLLPALAILTVFGGFPLCVFSCVRGGGRRFFFSLSWKFWGDVQGVDGCGNFGFPANENVAVICVLRLFFFGLKRGFAWALGAGAGRWGVNLLHLSGGVARSGGASHGLVLIKFIRVCTTRECGVGKGRREDVGGGL